MQMDEFKVGKPALVCRWRLSNRALPLENRHLRALGARVLNGRPVSVQLVAWAKQHIEWTLAEGASRYPDGTLMIMVDDLGRAAMTVGPYKPLETTTTSLLAERAALSAVESGRTGVAPETVWLVRGDELAWGVESDDTPSGAATLVRDLAQTTGFTVSREPGLSTALLNGEAEYDEVFMVSDEHGVVPARDALGPRSARLAEGYAKLLDSFRKH